MNTSHERETYHNTISKLLALAEKHTLYSVVFVSYINPKTKQEEGALHVYDNHLGVLECAISLYQGYVDEEFDEYYYYIMRFPHILILDTSEHTTTLEHMLTVEKYNMDGLYVCNSIDWSSYLKPRVGLGRLVGNSSISEKVLRTQTYNVFNEIIMSRDEVPKFDDVTEFVYRMDKRLLSYLPLSGLPIVYVYGVEETTLVNLYNVLTGVTDVTGTGTDVHEVFLKEALRTDVLHSVVNRSDFGRVLIGSLLVSHRDSDINIQPTCTNCNYEYEPEVVKLSDLVFDPSVTEVGEHVIASVKGKKYYYTDMLAKYNDDILAETDECRIYSKILSIPRMVIMSMSEEELSETLDIHNNITDSLTMSLTLADDIVCPGCSDSLKTIELISPIEILSEVLNK